jgi:hypothetical protein
MTGTKTTLPPQLVRALGEDRLIIFLGAGVSKAANLPSAESLAEMLAAELRADFEKDPQFSPKLPELERASGRLQEVAQLHYAYYKSRRTHQLVADRMAEAEERAKLGFLRPIKNLQNIREVFTTNYDCLPEKILGAANFQLIYRARDLRQALTPKLKLYKLHGTRTDTESMVLTLDDYSNYERNHQELIDALKTLLRQKSVVVVGYSMQDENFAKIYSEAVGDADDVRNFFVSPDASLMQQLRWPQKGFQHVPLSAEDFFPQLEADYNDQYYQEGTPSFPAPEKSPTPGEPLTNPFVLFDTEALIEDQPRFLFQTFVKPVDFPVILEHQHTIIEGHRGSGKSTILWRLSLKALAYDPSHLPMWGFYVKMVPGLFTSFRRRRDELGNWTDSNEDWMRCFTHYFNLVVVDGILHDLDEAVGDGVILANDKLPEVTMAIAKRLLRFQDYEEAKSLLSLSMLVEEALDTAVNDRQGLKFYTGATFLSRVLERLCEALPKLREKWWHVLLDEYDNVYPEQQAVVNILLRERHPKLRFKIAVKTLHMHLRDLDDKTFDPTDDFGYVSCDSFIWDRKQKAKYVDFLEEISNGRLSRSGYRTIQVRELFPEDDEEPEKYYAGFENYCLLSSGLTRQFLELCKDAVYEAFPGSAFSRVDLSPIPPRIQHHVARVHSAILFKSYRSCRFPQRVHRLFTVLGPLFWAIAECTKNLSEYRRPLSFEVTEMDKLTPETHDTLEDAIKSRLLQFPVIPKKPHNPRTEGPAQKYSFHRLLAPIFGLSINERYAVPVKSTDMNRIWTSPDRVREDLAKSYHSRGIQQYLQITPNLFDEHENDI